MLQLTHLSKHYTDGNKIIAALNDISLSFGKGEFVVVTGTSGSGKSTLLNILSGTDYATSGEHFFNETDTDSFSEEDWNKIGIGLYNFQLNFATKYYYSESEPTLNADGTAYDGNYWHYVDGVPTAWVK